MKIQIRSSVFETNSSSMHSLVVKKEDGYYADNELRRHLWIHNDGVWKIRNDEDITFGRYPFNCLCTFESKVRYAIASLCGWRKDAEERFKEIETLVKEIIPECTSIELPTPWGWDDDEDEDDKTSYGSVDEDILSPFLKAENVSLREFLTNKKYVVIVDGDEYCIWKDLKRSGLVNENEIEKEY